MTEPGSVQSSWFLDDEACLDGASPQVEAATQSSKAKQLLLNLEGPLTDADASDSREDWPVEGESLRSLVHKQVERIHHLEQALDQSLASLEELRLQLVNQQFLEEQLASTEEIANIQQRAIAQLKQQLAQQQEALEAHQHQVHEKTQSFQNLLDVMEGLAAGQQSRLEQLKTQIHRSPDQHQLATSNDATKSLPTPTSAESSVNLETRIQGLTQQLIERQAAIAQLEVELHRAHIALQEQQTLIDSWQQTDVARREAGEDSLDNELFIAHCKIQDLETEISKQLTTQAILQHSYRELEQSRDRYQARATELEQQTADMQEQILKQAQQGSEHETAIQHWKDRYLKSQDYLKQLKALIEQALPTPSDELAQLMAAIQAMSDIPEPDSSTAIVPHSYKMDLPDFLARRQRYRVRP